MALCRSRQNVFRLSTLLFCVLFHAGSPQSRTNSEVPRLAVQPVLTLKPDKIVVKTLEDTVKDLKIACSSPKPPDDRIQGIKKMTILRDLLDPPLGVTNPQIIVKADVTSTTRDAQEVLSSSGYVYEGELPLAGNNGHIAITIKAATCLDSGSYFCEMVYYNNLTRRVENEVTVLSTKALLLTDPLPVTLEPDPDLGGGGFNVGQTLNLTCTTNVGSVVNEIYTLMWEWSFRNENRHGIKPWVKFDEKDKIADGPDIKQKCSVNRSTSLTRSLTLEDQRREFRCMVVRKYSKPKIDIFEDTAASYVIIDWERLSNIEWAIGYILGIPIGLVALCCGTGIATCWWWRIRRRKKADAEVADKKAGVEEKRISVAMVAHKRTSMVGGDEIKDYGNILDKLDNPHDKGAATGVDDVSVVKSPVVDDESSIAPADSSTASAVVSSVEEIVSPPAEN